MGNFVEIFHTLLRKESVIMISYCQNHVNERREGEHRHGSCDVGQEGWAGGCGGGEAVCGHVCSVMHWITVDIAYRPPVLSASPTVGQLGLSLSKTVVGLLQSTEEFFLNE